MLQPRICKSVTSSTITLDILTTTLNSLSFCSRHPSPYTSQRLFSTTPHHLASHAQQGRANGPKDSAGRRLGSKKGASEYVIPGNIIFKQRGTKWFPGENCGMGRDHTIYALEYGYVQYYKNAALHPKRRYIGVALEREGKGSVLPTPVNAVSRRRLGMHAAPMKDINPTKEKLTDEIAKELLEKHRVEGQPVEAGEVVRPLAARPNRVYEEGRLTNWQIAQEADKNKVEVRPFDKRDRFYAWRQRTKKFKAKIALRKKGIGVKRKGKK